MITVVVVIIIIIIMPADNHDDDFEGSGVHYTCTEKYRKHFPRKYWVPALFGISRFRKPNDQRYVNNCTRTILHLAGL